MTSPNQKSSNVVPIDADERVLRNISKNDPYGTAQPLHGVERDRYIQRILSAAEGGGTGSWEAPRSRRFTMFHATAAALLLMGVGAALVLALYPTPNTPSEHVEIGVSLTENAVSPPAQTALKKEKEDAQSLKGPRVFSPSSGIGIALGQGAQATVRHASDSAVDVILSQGSLWSAVNPDIPHDRLTVITDDGRVEVKGTVFYVSKESHRSEVRVLRGKVQIRDREGRRMLLSAGRKIDVGAAEDHPLDPADIESGWSAVAAVHLAPRPKKPTVHPVHSVVRHNRAEKKGPSTTELLSDIRKLRREGDWQGTADKYETLIQIHRTSPAARAALISLGELRLRKLHEPKAALVLFNRYLLLNEPTLTREALLGKANALLALGRNKEATVVLREFLGRYPNAVQVDAVRKQLNEISAI